MTGHESDAHTPAPPPTGALRTVRPFAGRGDFPGAWAGGHDARVHELELEVDDLRRAVEEERAAAEVLRERLEQQEEARARVEDRLEAAVARSVRLGAELMTLWSRALNGGARFTAGDLRRALINGWSGDETGEEDLRR